MRFWDASAIVPLLVIEVTTESAQSVAAQHPAMSVWWATEVECASAIARLERDGTIDDTGMAQAFERLKQLAGGWQIIDATESVKEVAVRLLRVHPLRAADALQLAAAFVAADGRPPSLELVTLDDRLAAAARKEGFVLVDLPPSE